MFDILDQKLKCNYYDKEVLVRGDPLPLRYIIDILYEPIVDYSTLPILPVNVIEYMLKRDVDPEYAA